LDKTTLQDIAEYTGLSISTISRILRGESRADSKNVEQTIEAALKLNYPLNISYLNSKYQFKSQYHVALITTFFPGAFYASFFAGLNDASKRSPFDISLHDMDPNKTDIVDFVNGLISLHFDAAILFLPTLKESEYQRLLDEIPSTFTLLSVLPSLHPILDTITFDSYSGGYLMAQHFHERGYFDVGIINGPFSRNESLLRRNGFQDYITQNPQMNLVWSFDGTFDFQDGVNAFIEYENSEVKPRAIFATNDVMCIGFLKMATQRGVEIPNDVAIAGYDDFPVCKYVHPTITSIKTDYQVLGEKAFEVLKEKMEKSGKHSGMQSLIPVSISIREST